MSIRNWRAKPWNRMMQVTGRDAKNGAQIRLTHVVDIDASGIGVFAVLVNGDRVKLVA